MNQCPILADAYLLISESITYQTTDLIKGKVFKILLKRRIKDFIKTPFLVDDMGNILFSNLSRTGKICLLFSKDGKKFKKLNLEENISYKLGEYIKTIKKIKGEKIDCSSFVYFLYGSPVREKNGDIPVVLDMNLWNSRRIDLEELSSGDIIFAGEITKENLNNGTYHWLVYLGEGLFISKYYGMNGFVIINSDALFEMEKNNTLNLMTPKFIPNFNNKLEDYIL